MDKRIIVNADDFGRSDGVNKAVAQAHTKGVLTSATVMANMPAAEQAVKIAKELPSLGVGIHLNLSEGRPILKDARIKCIVGADGRFAYSPVKLALLSTAIHSIRNAIRAELTAQIQWLIDNGLKPTHLDSHRHIHSFPAIFTIVCELARRFRIATIRWCFEPKQLCRMPWPLTDEVGRKKAGLVRTQALINRMQNPHFLKTEALLGVAHTGKIDVNFLKAVTLYNPAQTAEIMTHPGLPDKNYDIQQNANPDNIDNRQTKLLYRQKVELEALCSERTKQYFKDAGIRLVHYGQL